METMQPSILYTPTRRNGETGKQDGARWSDGVRGNDDRRGFQLLSLLLQYPDPAWLQMEDLRAAANDLKDPVVQEAVLRFLAYLESKSVHELTEAYVHTFDFNPRTALYLTYSATGEERERGTALVRLKQLYAEMGWELAVGELPDYFPLLLEFVAIAPRAVAEQLLREFAGPIGQLEAELASTGSPYAWLVQACLAYARPFLT